MVNYRRNYVSGGTYFFTVTLRDRSSNLLIAHIELLRAAFRLARHKRPFQIDAIVILPDHLHAIWTLPDGDDNYSARWQAIKSHFTHALVKAGVQLTHDAKGEYDLWQRRFWEHTIADERDYQHHIDYIHYNPVKHGWVKQPLDWQYTSLHRYIQQGQLPPNWASDATTGEFGE